MLTLAAPKKTVTATIHLSGSKSISNRLLIINEVLSLNLVLKNNSTSEDTLLLQNALQKIKNKSKAIINVHHAGTDMRFLTALLATTEGEWVLTGSKRMKERPIGELVTGLKKLGAKISYLENKNFPPLKINGKKLKGGKVEIDGSVSSQFISALLLVAPSFEKGLELTLKHKLVSWPYIQMTIDLLKQVGVKIKQTNNVITVLKSKSLLPKSNVITVESDWSSASYWYSICALKKGSKIELMSLNKKSLQADAIIPKLFNRLGVTTRFKKDGIEISNKNASIKKFNYDCTNCPDIAQTLAVTCFGLGISAQLTGLQTLKLKESDRLIALKTELEKLGATVEITDNTIMVKSKGHKTQDTGFTTNNSKLKINTYNDHRMAMSFAPLAIIFGQLQIQNPSVISKSYPLFWEDLKSVGFSVNLQP